MEPANFQPGEYVLVSSPNFFKGKKLGAYLRPCKDHEGGHRVYLTNLTTITKEVCVNPNEPGNSIVRVDDIKD